VHKELQTLWNELPKDAPTELGAFIDVHALILSDPMISEAPLDIIRTAPLQRRMGAADRSTSCRRSSTKSKTLTCASARPTSSKWPSACSRCCWAPSKCCPRPAGGEDEFQPQMIVGAISRRPTCCSSATAPSSAL
jgi:phosphotransferase system enzyme I (PtsI)